MRSSLCVPSISTRVAHEKCLKGIVVTGCHTPDVEKSGTGPMPGAADTLLGGHAVTQVLDRAML
ncbi:MAG: hypothetical protein GIW97_07380 [Candidatus Eremiobacteraeota bacterium]|nr:hypothetical protein [Candidatus Eremiobacteraeota bacterium]